MIELNLNRAREAKEPPFLWQCKLYRIEWSFRGVSDQVAHIWVMLSLKRCITSYPSF